MKFCGYCGTDRSDGARFCGNCGGDLTALEQELEDFTAQYAAELLDFEDVQYAIQVEDEGPATSMPAASGDAGSCLACGATRSGQGRFCADCGQPFAASPSASPANPPTAVPQTAFVATTPEPEQSASPEPEPEPPARLREPPVFSVAPRAPDAASMPQPAAPLSVRPGPAPAPPPASAPDPVVDDWDEPDPAPPRRGGALIAMLALLLFAVAGGAYWTGLIGSRPTAIAQDLQLELQAAGYREVEVAAGPGFSMVLSGSVRDAAEQDAVIVLAGAHSGVNDVVTQLEFKPPLAERLAELNRFIANELGEPGAVLAEDASNFVLRGYTEAPGGAQLVLTALRDRRGLGAISDQTVPRTAATEAAAPATGEQLPQADPQPFVPQQTSSTPARTNATPTRAAAPPKVPATRPAAVDSPLVSCLLPSADEVRLSLAECRNRNGLVQ